MWLPAERLGTASIDANLRRWLIGQGVLSERVKAVCGERFTLREARQGSAVLSDALKQVLRTADNAALFGSIDMACGEAVWVVVQSVTPDSTLALHAWLAELGDAPLDQTLLGLSGVERGPYEYAWLPAGAIDLVADPVAGSGAALATSGAWARRSRFALRGAPLLLQEAFLPAVGRG